jgi:methylmalonyl-CoA epimerase
VLPELSVVDHMGIAVRDTADALRLYCDLLGLRAGTTEVVPSENLKITFLDGANSRVEILEPLPGDSAVARFLEKRGEGLHHVCFVVSDVAATLAQLADAGYQLVDEHPRPGRHGELLAFVHPKTAHGVLIELYQIDSAAQRGVAGGVTDGGSRGTERIE